MNRLPYIIGIIVLLTAIYQGIEADNTIMIVLAGLLTLANFTAIKKVRPKNDLFNVIINMGNSMLSFFVGYDLLEKDKVYIPYIYFTAALFFLIVTYIIYKRNLQPFKRFSSK